MSNCEECPNAGILCEMGAPCPNESEEYNED